MYAVSWLIVMCMRRRMGKNGLGKMKLFVGEAKSQLFEKNPDEWLRKIKIKIVVKNYTQCLKTLADNVVQCVAITRYGGEKSLYFIIQKQQYSGKAINSGSYGYGQLSAWKTINKHVFEICVCEVWVETLLWTSVTVVVKRRVDTLDGGWFFSNCTVYVWSFRSDFSVQY